MSEARRSAAYYVRFVLGLLLTLGLAAVFIYSALSKVYSLEPFSWSILDLAPVGLTAAGILARIFIGIEFLLGAFLLAHLFLKQFTYKAVLIFLGIMSLYLIFLLIKEGNAGSCGCFGEWIYMNPLQSLLKNLGMMALVFLLLKFYPGRGLRGQPYYLAAFLATASLVTPFVMEPVAIYGSGEKANDPINLNPLYQADVQPVPAEDLRTGKHIIAYLSLTCPHCKKAAYLLQIMHRQYPELPLFMVLSGRADQLTPFFEETKSKTLPHAYMPDNAAFQSMSGPYVPSIYWINNSVIERKTYYLEINPSDVKAWLKEK